MIFDYYLMVDWSAANKPKTGNDSIWLALADSQGQIVNCSNPPTRATAISTIVQYLTPHVQAGRKVLVGFDFPFGFPNWTRVTSGKSGTSWGDLWGWLSQNATESATNQNNRFDVAASLNKKLTGRSYPFWGHPGQNNMAHLPVKRGIPAGCEQLRLTEACAQSNPGPKSVFQVYYKGSAGGQAIVGIPQVQALRSNGLIAQCTKIWPFETGFALPNDATIVVVVEIYPSLIPIAPLPGMTKDEAQVRQLATHYANEDAAGTLAALFTVGQRLPAALRRRAEEYEGWILGVT